MAPVPVAAGALRIRHELVHRTIPVHLTRARRALRRSASPSLTRARTTPRGLLMGLGLPLAIRATNDGRTDTGTLVTPWEQVVYVPLRDTDSPRTRPPAQWAPSSGHRGSNARRSFILPPPSGGDCARVTYELAATGVGNCAARGIVGLIHSSGTNEDERKYRTKLSIENDSN